MTRSQRLQSFSRWPGPEVSKLAALRQVVDILFVKGVKSKDERQAILASSIGAQSSQKKGRMSMDDLEIYPADGCS